MFQNALSVTARFLAYHDLRGQPGGLRGTSTEDILRHVHRALNDPNCGPRIVLSVLGSYSIPNPDTRIYREGSPGSVCRGFRTACSARLTRPVCTRAVRSLFGDSTRDTCSNACCIAYSALPRSTQCQISLLTGQGSLTHHWYYLFLVPSAVQS